MPIVLVSGLSAGRLHDLEVGLRSGMTEKDSTYKLRHDESSHSNYQCFLHDSFDKQWSNFLISQGSRTKINRQIILLPGYDDISVVLTHDCNMRRVITKFSSRPAIITESTGLDET